MSGRIVTFYSYKGGAGRSMALANVAWTLASAGRRVLVIDWDLESPGVHRYFRPFLRDPDLIDSPGVIDYFVQAAADAATNQTEGQPGLLHHASSLDFKFPVDGTLDFVGAGRQDSGYALLVNGFNWHAFYERLGGRALLDRLRTELQAAYDDVLIDSRTGVSDFAAICTATMPDALVVCFTLNSQSLDGSAAVAARVQAIRTVRPVDLFPVPMRVDYAEKDLLEQARTLARAKFKKLTRSLDREYWNRVEFPYIPFYAYTEMLAAFADAPYSTNSVLGAAENLAGYLTGGAVSRTQPVPDDIRQEIRNAYARAGFEGWPSANDQMGGRGTQA
jgi:cellulose biosynthesis protein BcsQ